MASSAAIGSAKQEVDATSQRDRGVAEGQHDVGVRPLGITSPSAMVPGVMLPCPVVIRARKTCSRTG
jgi:hypothetical protein